MKKRVRVGLVYLILLILGPVISFLWKTASNMENVVWSGMEDMLGFTVGYLIISLVFYLSLVHYNAVESVSAEKLTSEIDMSQVGVKGVSKFISHVTITYKDGVLVDIESVPGAIEKITFLREKS